MHDGTVACIVASLFSSTDLLTVAESPTFCHAYAPAIRTLQQMTVDMMPLFAEIVSSKCTVPSTSMKGLEIDVSGAVSLEDSRDPDLSLLRMSADTFVRAAGERHNSYKAELNTGSVLFQNTLDPSQRKALSAAIEERLWNAASPF